MKKAIFLSFVLFLFPCVCLALTVDDNGYAWIAASREEKSGVSRQLSEANGKDSAYWVEMLDAFYGVNNWQIRSLKIKKVADQISPLEQSAGKSGE